MLLLSLRADADSTTEPSTRPTVDAVMAELSAMVVRAMPADISAENRERLLQERRALNSHLSTIRELIDQRDLESARQRAQNLLQQVHTPEARRLVTQLITHLAVGMEKRTEDLFAEIDTIIASIRGDLSRGDADLPALRERLDDMQSRLNRGNSVPPDRMHERQRAQTRLYEISVLLERWQQALAAEKSGDLLAAYQSLTEVSQLDRNLKLIPAGLIKEKREAIEQASAKQFDGVFAKARDELAKAETVEAVDKVAAQFRQDIQDLQRQRLLNPYAEGQQQWDRALVVMDQWAAVIDHESAGRYRAARQEVERLIPTGTGSQLTDRTIARRLIGLQRLSETAARLENLISNEANAIREPELRKIVADFDAVADTAAIRKLGKVLATMLRGPSKNYDNKTITGELGSLLLEFAALESLEDHLINRRFGEFWKELRPPARRASRDQQSVNLARHRWNKKTAAWSLDLILRASIDSRALPAEAFEDASLPTDRAKLAFADQAAAAGDYRAALGALDAYRLAFYGGYTMPAWLAGDLFGLEAYEVARNLDAAGDVVGAAGKYFEAIGSTGPRVPVEAITRRLAEIRQQDPTVIERARQLPAKPATTKPSNDWRIPDEVIEEDQQ